MATTRLSLLLTHLHISAKDLSENIHVDPSLVSRWKTGDRVLPVNSSHFTNIITYIMESDARTGYRNIETFFRYYTPDGELYQNEDICITLEKWLSAYPPHYQRARFEKIDNPSNFSEVGILKGGKEKRDALLNFLDTAVFLSEKKNIYIMIGRDTNGFLEKNPFYIQWIAKLHEILSHGHHIYFIYDYSFGSFINNLKEFYSLCSSGLYHAYYLPKRGSLTTSFNLCIIEDVFALTDFTPCDDSMNKPVCFSFTDPNIVGRLKIQYMNYLESCRALTNDTISVNQEQIYNFLENRILEEQDIYIYEELPFLFPVNSDLLSNILVYNSFTPDEINYALKCYENVLYKPMMNYSRPGGSACRMMLNIDMLLSHISDDHYIYPPSLISPKKIIIPKRFYRHFINEISRYVSTPTPDSKLEIALINNNYMKINTGITFLTKNNLYSLAYPHTPEYENAMLFTNSTIIADTHNYLEDFWTNMPDENKNKINIKAQLNKLLSLLCD